MYTCKILKNVRHKMFLVDIIGVVLSLTVKVSNIYIVI